MSIACAAMPFVHFLPMRIAQPGLEDIMKNLFLDYLKNKLRLECEKIGLAPDSLTNCDEPGHGFAE